MLKTLVLPVMEQLFADLGLPPAEDFGNTIAEASKPLDVAPVEESARKDASPPAPPQAAPLEMVPVERLPAADAAMQVVEAGCRFWSQNIST